MKKEDQKPTAYYLEFKFLKKTSIPNHVNDCQKYKGSNNLLRNIKTGNHTENQIEPTFLEMINNLLLTIFSTILLAVERVVKGVYN